MSFNGPHVCQCLTMDTHDAFKSALVFSNKPHVFQCLSMSSNGPHVFP
jgi:hypothetical protein